MERKIGEIFEYKGEWYQCLKSPDENCTHCDMDFGRKCPNIKECTGTYRIDKKNVIFNKLEKVGEPYAYTFTTDKIYNVLMQQYKVNYDEIIPFVIGHFFILNPQTNTIAIELKQNQEDMEEKKLNLKPFDLEAAKAGKPVCTRDGRKARIICFDVKAKKPIAALITNDDTEEVHFYYDNGRSDQYQEYRYDLMMLPKKKEGWVNIIKTATPKRNVGCLYDTREEALSHLDSLNDSYVATVKLEWEE